MDSREEWFGQLKGKASFYGPLICSTQVVGNYWQAIVDAVGEYIAESLEASDLTVHTELDDCTLAKIANRTPNGLLRPKQELEAAYGAVHAASAAWFKSLRIDSGVATAYCPVNVRLIGGNASEGPQRPYDSASWHTDIWNGDPGDYVGVNILMAGDVERTGIEFAKSLPLSDDHYIKQYADYRDAHFFVGNPTPYDTSGTIPGTAFISDATVLHRTARKGGGPRISLDFHVRRKVPDPERIRLSAHCPPGRLQGFIPYADWLKVGSTKALRFRETMADAIAGKIPGGETHNLAPWEVVDL